MKESVFQEKMNNLKKKKEQLNDSIKKHKAKVAKYESEVDEVDKQILILNHKYSALSAEEMVEALALYKKQKEEKENQLKETEKNQVSSNDNNNIYGGYKQNET